MKLGRVGRWIALGFAGLLVYAIVLVIFMPAEYVARVVNHVSPDVVMKQATGTLWRGVRRGDRGAG